MGTRIGSSGPRPRSIGVAIGFMPVIIEVAVASVGPVIRAYRFVKGILFKPEPPRVLYVWRVGTDENQAGFERIADVAGRLADGKDVHGHDVDMVMTPVQGGYRYIWRIGSDEHPAVPGDLEAFADLLKEWRENPEVNSIVHHHAVDLLRVPSPESGEFSVIFQVEAGQNPQVDAVVQDQEKPA